MGEFWVINASPIILLAKADLIGLVPSLAQKFVIPEPVAEEIRQGDTADAAVKWVNGERRQFIKPAAAVLAGIQESDIGPGERSVISWAIANPSFMAILDDRVARAIGERLGLQILGTVGVVLRLKKTGLIGEVKSHLVEIRRKGGFISEGLFLEALRRAGEK